MVTHEHQILGFQEEEALGTKRREKYGWVNGRVSRKEVKGGAARSPLKERAGHPCQKLPRS